MSKEDIRWRLPAILRHVMGQGAMNLVSITGHAAASAILVVVGLGQPGLADERFDPRTVNTLHTLASKSEWVRIIVTLAPSAQPLAPVGDELRFSEISALQDRVLDRLGEGAALIRRYRALPQLAIRANPEGLKRLHGDPEVTAIHPDSLMAPSGPPSPATGSTGGAR